MLHFRLPWMHRCIPPTPPLGRSCVIAPHAQLPRHPSAPSPRAARVRAPICHWVPYSNGGPVLYEQSARLWLQQLPAPLLGPAAWSPIFRRVLSARGPPSQWIHGPLLLLYPPLPSCCPHSPTYPWHWVLPCWQPQPSCPPSQSWSLPSLWMCRRYPTCLLPWWHPPSHLLQCLPSRRALRSGSHPAAKRRIAGLEEVSGTHRCVQCRESK